MYPLVISEEKCEEMIRKAHEKIEGVKEIEIIKYEGEKDLSIEIKKQKRAHVFTVYFTMKDTNKLGEGFREFNRLLGLNPNVLRYMIERVYHNQVFTLNSKVDIDPVSTPDPIDSSITSL